MADDKSLLVILHGTFFRIVQEKDNKVIAKCVATMSFQEPEMQLAIFCGISGLVILFVFLLNLKLD